MRCDRIASVRYVFRPDDKDVQAALSIESDVPWPRVYYTAAARHEAKVTVAELRDIAAMFTAAADHLERLTQDGGE